MSVSSETIDRIVANVLSQLNATSAVPQGPAPLATPPAGASSARASVIPHGIPRSTGPSLASASALPAEVPSSAQSVVISETVVTAELLESVPVATVVQVLPKALLTPAARDVIKARQLQIVREQVTSGAATTVKTSVPSASEQSSLMIVVKNSKPLEQLWGEISSTWRRELVSCPDDAAKLAIAELCRGGATQVLIIAEQTHRAACLANRNDKIKAVAIRDAGDIRLVRRQLKANTWCFDAQGKTYFELKNILRELQR